MLILYNEPTRRKARRCAGSTTQITKRRFTKQVPDHPSKYFQQAHLRLKCAHRLKAYGGSMQPRARASRVDVVRFACGLELSDKLCRRASRAPSSSNAQIEAGEYNSTPPFPARGNWLARGPEVADIRARRCSAQFQVLPSTRTLVVVIYVHASGIYSMRLGDHDFAQH